MTLRHVAAGVLGVSVASGCSAFKLDNVPPDVARAFEQEGDPNCAPDTRRARRVASSEDIDGTRVELWMAPANNGGDALAVMVEEPGQPQMGSGGWCNQDAPAEIVNTFGGLGMSSADGRERNVVLGRAPERADAVRATYPDREVIIDVGGGGYFIVVHSRAADGDNMMGMADPVLTALDADGNEL